MPGAARIVLGMVAQVIHESGLVLFRESLNAALDAVEKVKGKITAGKKCAVVVDVVGQLGQETIRGKSACSTFQTHMDRLVLCGIVFALPVFAASDPLVVVENLSTFIFSLIRAVGLILLGWGIVQVGLSLQSHDPSQRSQGFLTLAGGLVITFAKEILDLITA